MIKHKITGFQYFTIFFFLLNSFIPLIGFHTITMISNQDALFSIIIGSILMIFFAFLIRNIYFFLPNKTLFEKIKFLFPKGFYFFIGIIFLLCGFILLFVTQEFTGFVHFYLLPEVHQFLITVPFLLLIFYFLRKDQEVIFKTSEICFYFYILFFIISMFGILPQSNFLKIKPLFSTNITSIFKSSLYFFLSFPLPFFLLLYFPKNSLKKKENGQKNWIKSILFSGIFLFITLFLILSSLGIQLTNLYKNPLMITYQKISFLNILERVEATLSFSYILLYLFPMVLLIYLLKELILDTFSLNPNYEDLVLSLLLIGNLLGNQFFQFPTNFYFDISIFFVIFLLFLSIFSSFKKE